MYKKQIIIENTNKIRIEKKFMRKTTEETLKRVSFSKTPKLTTFQERNAGRFKGIVVKGGSTTDDTNPVDSHLTDHFSMRDTSLPGKPITAVLTSSKKIGGPRISDEKPNNDFVETKTKSSGKSFMDDFGYLDKNIKTPKTNIVDNYGSCLPHKIKGGQQIVYPNNLIYVEEGAFEENPKVTAFFDKIESTIAAVVNTQPDYSSRPGITVYPPNTTNQENINSSND